MNFKAIIAALESDLYSFWAGDANTPIFSEGATINTAEDFYLYCEVVFSDAVKLDIPRGCTVDVIGTLSIQVVGPQQNGKATCYTYADTLNNHFSDKQIGIVNTEPGRILNVTNTDDNKYRLNVLVPFSVYQTS